nr:hypothetical protein [Burkholderia anthina]
MRDARHVVHAGRHPREKREQADVAARGDRLRLDRRRVVQAVFGRVGIVAPRALQLRQRKDRDQQRPRAAREQRDRPGLPHADADAQRRETILDDGAGQRVEVREWNAGSEGASGASRRTVRRTPNRNAYLTGNARRAQDCLSSSS